MNLGKLCYGCFREKETEFCPYCGFSPNVEQPFLALPLGTILNGRYLTGKVLGIGGFGITYLGFDMTLEIKVAIKEYMPSGLATRNADKYNVALTGHHESDYRAGEERFLDEARILAKLQNTPNIVSVQNYFRENNTAYFVMEYIDGTSLKDYLARSGNRIPYVEAKQILLPIMEALTQVHSMNLMHRDISPDNIYLTHTGESRLLDFGAARFSTADNKSVSVILKHGYAPEEQYSSHGNQGPWTDVYAMGATLYASITGFVPPDAIERSHHDTIAKPSDMGVDIPPREEAALMKALAIHVADRYASMGEFIAALNGAPGQIQRGTVVMQPDMGSKGEGFAEKLRRNPALKWGMVGGGALVLLLAILIPVLISAGKKPDTQVASRTSEPQSSYEISIPQESSQQNPFPQEPSDVESSTPFDSSEEDESSEEIESSEDEDLHPLDTTNWSTKYVELLNLNVMVPNTYTADSNYLMFKDEYNDRTIWLDYYWNLNTPIYSIADVYENYDKIIYKYIYGESIFVNYELDQTGEVSIGGVDGFAAKLDTTLDGQEYTVVFVAMDGQGPMGCYIAAAAVRPEDTDGLNEVLTVLDSMESQGIVETTWNVFSSDVLGEKFIYDVDIAGDPTVYEGDEEENTINYAMFYPGSMNNNVFVEIDAPSTNYESAATAVSNACNAITENGIGTANDDAYESERGGMMWNIQEFTMPIDDTDYTFIFAALDTDVGVILVGACTDEENEDHVVELFNEVLRSVRPLE